MGKPIPLADRFWARVAKSDDCWMWTGATQASGRYGQISLRQGVPKSAHHVSWFLAHSEWPPSDLVVCHQCDVTLCVRPSHLFLGTQGDNIRDMHAKGRAARNGMGHGIAPKGEAQGSAVLTDEIVRQIRARVAVGELQREVGASYGVHQSHVSKIVLRKIWGHVT